MVGIRGTDNEQGPHGCPPDLVDRLLIVRTLPYTMEEIRQIVLKRSQCEKVAVSTEALGRLAQLGAARSLRYAVQLLSPANVLAGVSGRGEVSVSDVDEAEQLFLDARRSTRVLEANARLYL